MVNMAHHCHNWWPRLGILTQMDFVFLWVNGINIFLNNLNVDTQFLNNNFRRFKVNPLINRGHNAILKQLAHQLDYGDAQLFR